MLPPLPPPTTNTCLFARTRCVYVCARVNLQYVETTIIGYMQAAALRAIMISIVKAATLLNIQRPTLTRCRLYICNNNLLVLQVLHVITEFILLLKEEYTLSNTVYNVSPIHKHIFSTSEQRSGRERAPHSWGRRFKTEAKFHKFCLSKITRLSHHWSMVF